MRIEDTIDINTLPQHQREEIERFNFTKAEEFINLGIDAIDLDETQMALHYFRKACEICPSDYIKFIIANNAVLTGHFFSAAYFLNELKSKNFQPEKIDATLNLLYKKIFDLSVPRSYVNDCQRFLPGELPIKGLDMENLLYDLVFEMSSSSKCND